MLNVLKELGSRETMLKEMRRETSMTVILILGFWWYTGQLATWLTGVLVVSWAIGMVWAVWKHRDEINVWKSRRT